MRKGSLGPMIIWTIDRKSSARSYCRDGALGIVTNTRGHFEHSTLEVVLDQAWKCVYYGDYEFEL